jgi:hypothetical protein
MLVTPRKFGTAIVSECDLLSVVDNELQRLKGV